MSEWDILVLDKSGSMNSNKNDLIDGFNNLVSEQKKENSTNKFTVISFNETVEVIKDDTFPNVSFIESKDLILKGTTALYDAIGYAYDLILKNTDYTNINLTVITDGIENSSKIYTKYTLNDLKNSINEKFTFKMIFIGTDSSCLIDDEINLHATQSIECSGSIQKALKIASRTMSSTRDGSQYIPEGIVETNPVTPLVLKRSFSSSDEKPPIIKKCKTYCNF